MRENQSLIFHPARDFRIYLRKYHKKREKKTLLSARAHLL